MTRFFRLSPGPLRTASLSWAGRLSWFAPARAAVNGADARSAVLAPLLVLVLAGCHTGEAPPSFVGYGVTSDARAAQVGRSVMESGGNAVDVAVAMALTMAVTTPSRAGLGGGGVCLIHDPATKAVRTLDFLPESVGSGSRSSGAVAVPTFLRGLYALHAAYGHRRWEEALGAAEALVATGVPVSATLAADLQAAAPRLRRDAAARAVFLTADAVPLAEGETLVQADLAATLRTVRQRGVGAFYSAALSGGLAATVAEGLGGDASQLAGYQPQWRATSAVDSGNDEIHFPLYRAGDDGGLSAAWTAAVEARDGAWLGALVGALAPAAGAAAPAALLSVSDVHQQAVACVLTLGARFGAARLLPETGILAAVVTDPRGLGGPALVVNHHQGTTLFAGVGATGGGGDEGGGSAAAALLTTLHASVIEEGQGPGVVAAPRAAPQAGGGVLAEAAVPAALLGPAAALRRSVASLGQVEAVACQYNAHNGFQRCEAVADPRGPGVHFTVLK